MKRALVLLAGLAATACGGGDTSATPPASTAPLTVVTYPDAPAAPTGANDSATEQFEAILATLPDGLSDPRDLDAFVEVADIRHAWLISDVMRFIRDEPTMTSAIAGFDALTGVDIAQEPESARSPWNAATNLLIAWDIPAPPDYRRLKGEFFTLAEEGWAPFFDDADSDIDWRWVSWGGVFIDDRPLGARDPCAVPGCIPALDDPALVPAADGGYYDDDAIVFGVTEGDESVAFPKNVMQIHEMVNITIGGRRFGIPYCTLCGSAQAFSTDQLPEGVDTPVLRTSGLLNRSNKVMYDLVTKSVFDTFTGAAVSGPLQDAGVVLDQNSVTVSTWGEWKTTHPDTRIVAEDGGIGRSYPSDPLRGRDDAGPIFPIGDVDPRLGVQAPVLGVLLADGSTVAFSVEALRDATADGDTVEFEDVVVKPDAGGFTASVGGNQIGVHEAFWFAWSQFHPATQLWPDDAEG
jgi:Protein of unknown function (DUF3179)